MKKNLKSFLIFTLCLCFLASSYGTELVVLAKNTDKENNSQVEWIDDDEDDEDNDDDEETSENENQSNAGQSEDDANKAKLEELTKESKKLEEERKKIEASINNAKSQKQQQQAIKESLNEKINNTVSQIGVLQERITLLEEEIEETEDAIAKLEKTIEKNFQLFLQRVRASYISGDVKPMSVVLGADSYYDSLVAVKTAESIANHDNQLIESLNSDKKEVEDALAALDANKKDLEASQKSLEAKKEEFNGELEATNAEIQSITQLEQEFLADLEANKKKSAEMQAEMNAIFAKINSQGEYVGGEMLWPVPGFSTISSYYGYRWNNTDFHTGIDITGSGVNGHTIVAANSGTVAVANTSYVPGRGYGKYVIVDHGGGMLTLYGHCSELLVSEGDKVVKGTPIAKVGSTGWSTGPHLHFDIRKNNQHTNPLPYLKG